MKLVGTAALALLAVLPGCPNEGRNDSINAANEGAKAYGQKQYETAIAAYLKAVEKSDKNDNAWYGLSAAYAGKQDWPKAADAMAHAVQLVPEQPMYQLYYGRFIY